jgi:predicted dehydrogenase/nucleoside-diphosphate-sugar epimerase
MKMDGQQTDRVLRVGVIGAGKMGLNHLKAINGCQSGRVVAIADPQADTEQLAPLLPQGAEVLHSAEELLDRVRPDVVHIVTPPHTHTALATMALERGAHVYIEKPFAMTLADAKAILDLAAARGLRACAGHQCLYEHSARQGRAMLAQLGRVVHIESYFAFRQVRRSISPVDQAKDILPHAVYMLVDFIRAVAPDETLRVETVDAGADGSVYCLVRIGDCRGTVTVTLTGRPVEHWIRVVGTNGTIRADLVSDAVSGIVSPGASGVGAIAAPYRLAWQSVTRSATGLVRKIRQRKYGYAGHRDLCDAFYSSIATGSPSPISPQSILETVLVCERVHESLDRADRSAEEAATASLAARQSAIARQIPAVRGRVVVTGAGGFLGRPVVGELRASGWQVRALTRQPLPIAQREPGVDYVTCDLASGIPHELVRDASVVVHCAAETRGGKRDHERNSIRATAQVIAAMSAAGITRLVHVSSVAVLDPKRTTGGAFDESTPVAIDDLTRGPYAWGKAESERLVSEANANGLDAAIIRLGPLVDFGEFDPPGRLGRDLGFMYAAVGPRNGRLDLCDVHTAARVIRAYADDRTLPPVLNLIEPDAPKRRELVDLFLRRRPGLRVMWIPMWLLRVVSPPLSLLQRVVLRTSTPLNIASAFRSMIFRSDLARHAIDRANQTATTATTDTHEPRLAAASR